MRKGGRGLAGDLVRLARARLASVSAATGTLVVIIDQQLPDPTSDAGSTRIVALTRELQRRGHRVAVVGLLGGSASALNDLGATAVEGPDAFLDALKLCRGSSLIVVSRPHVAARFYGPLALLCPGTPVVYDSVDVHGERIAREAALDVTTWSPSQQRSVRRLERKCVKYSDLAMFVSERDQAMFDAKHSPPTSLIFPVISGPPNTLPVRSGRRGSLFLGNISHPPNRDALKYLTDSLLDLLPQVALPVRIVGPGSREAIGPLADPRLEVLDWIPTLDRVLSESIVLLAPLRFGSGINGKIVVAMAAGLPVITTAVGAEGLGPTTSPGCLIGETPAGFARAASTVATDDSLWQDLSSAGLAYASKWFGQESLARVCEDLDGLVRRRGSSATVRRPATRLRRSGEQ